MHMLVLAMSVGLFLNAPADGAEAVDFSRDVRPILAAQCFACHGPDAAAREADLRLDTRAGATRDLDGRRAVVAGDVAASELVKRIESDDDDVRMPPPDSGHQLSESQKQVLKSWIAAGAEYNQHWSFVAPVRPDVPDADDSDWATSPIDHFVLARLQSRGLSPSRRANRYQLIRRVSLDLTGLPPTPQEAADFVDDTSSDAYEKVVRRLLDSPRYGEHWARLWLDLARYADTQGYEKDKHRDIWRYRDWVIDAFNQDMPYDQFTVEQLAGDLLTQPTPDQLLATAFHRNTMTNTEGGTDDEEFRLAAVKDRIETTAQVWMGLTLRCANCHSHKYDPISQREYYQFMAFFNQTEDHDAANDHPRAETPTTEQQQRLEELEAALQAAGDARQKPLEQQLAALKKQFPTTPIMRELPAEKHRQTHVHVRGNFLEKGDLVTAAVPESLHALPADSPMNRLGVARWLVARNNPLTARVAVNRIWARLFGIGIVETEEDFGTQGTEPTHPELLDWLAVEFMDTHRWSQKELLRSIVMSSTYCQDSTITEAGAELDPRNRYFSRGPRFRLAAEVIRDQALVAAGLISSKTHGPSVMPPQPDGIWRSVYNGAQWQTASGEDRFRRGLYTYWRRTSPYPSMLSFDAGSREVCLIRRIRTNTPLQALILLNDPVYLEAAGALARRMIHEGGDNSAARVDFGFRQLLVRPPEDAEVASLVRFYESTRLHFDADPKAAETLLKSCHTPPLENATVVDLASWTAVASVLLNLDEGVTKP